MRLFGAKALAVLLLTLSLLAWTGGTPAWAQPPTAEPETVLLNPEGVVNVQDLPRVGPRVPVHREMPFRVPDLQQLLDTKARHQARTQPAPTATVQGSGTFVSITSTGLTGLRFSESGGYVPPDTQIGVGPNYIVEAVNLEMRIWDRSNLTLPQTSSLCSFFNVSCSSLSDPKIRFDPVSQRWFIAAITYNTSFTAGAWRLAVSVDQNPFTFVRWTNPTSKSAPDFPAIGINDDKVVLTANAFRGNSFLGTEFLVINKANLLANGTTSAASTYFPPPQGLFTIQPAHSLSSTCSGTPSVCTLYMAAVAYNSATSIQVWSVNGVPGVGLVTPSTVNFSINSLTSPPDAQQKGTSTLIQTNDNRLLDAAYRNGALWVSANSACVPSSDTTRACLRFIQFLTTGGVSKNQDFDFGQFGFYYYYPAIQIDGGGNLLSVFSGSSSSAYAGVYASGQKADSQNTFKTPATVHAGEHSYNPFANRWGDYSGAAFDPSDSTTVWVAGEYARIEGGSEWGTWLAPVQIGP